MKIQAPGGFVTVLSILWLLLGLLFVYAGFTVNYGAFFVAPFLVVPSLLLWVGSYRAANFFIFCLMCTVLVSMGKLCLLFSESGLEVAVKSPLIGRIVFCIVCIPSLWRWSDARNPEMQKA